MPLALLLSAVCLSVGAVVCVGLALARCVASPGITLLIAGLATTADLYSFLASPTRALV
jgi:hypothetical protein